MACCNVQKKQGSGCSQAAGIASLWQEGPMFGFTSRTRTLLCAISLMALPVVSQQNPAQQNLPDGPAPKKTTPQNQFPEDAPQAPKNVHPGNWFCRSEEHTSELQSLRHLVC